MQVIVYEKPDCVQCDRTKQFLTREGIDYDPRPITAELAETFKAQGLMSAPIVKTPDGQVWAGFRPDLIKALAQVAA